jgi:hypothetical protein
MSTAVTITLGLDSAPLQCAFQELAARFESLYRSELLDEQLRRHLGDLGAGIGVEKMFKTVTVPASGAYGLALQLQPSDELLSLIATLRALERKGDVVHEDKASTATPPWYQECTAETCAKLIKRAPYTREPKEYDCYCGAVAFFEGTIPLQCANRPRAEAWLKNHAEGAQP